MRRLAALAVAVCCAFPACKGALEDAGEIRGGPAPIESVWKRERQQTTALRALGADVPKQILFGDLHVHTTFSVDAFLRTLPFMQGEGSHPPADACDFARHCSALDFWSINDHAEGITPEHWRETVESIRQCNALAGDPTNPDVVAFLGWEWTQVGLTGETHYGHKNVVLKGLDDDEIPARPISARDEQLAAAFAKPPPWYQRVMLPLLDFPNRQRYFDFARLLREMAGTPLCPDDVPSPELPADCHETAPTPDVLFRKLDEWKSDAIVIPHGTTWGFYTPPTSSLDKQLRGDHYDPDRQFLFEIFSGHGNSEEYRPWTPATLKDDGSLVCPEPTSDYEPCCWRAGEIIRSRCEDPASKACDERVRTAQRLYLEAGAAGHLTVPGTTVEDWLDCGQCRDCYLPAFNYRPRNSAQYALAIGNFDDPAKPRHFRFGFLGSSDNHSARPGTGYKEYARRKMTEAIGARDATWRSRIVPDDPTRPEPRARDEFPELPVFLMFEFERQASFFMTGGLVATHAAGRDRDAIWDAFRRREVYGTSGDRILLWFDVLNAPGGSQPMGSEVDLFDAPRFRVRAVGAFEQLPGCPDDAKAALGEDRLELLCRGECYHPSDTRRSITQIEVVRIRPQQSTDEPVEDLIEDPWRRFECTPDPAGCVVEFTDPDFLTTGRETAYYVRAVQEPTPAVNAGNLRCERDDSGACVAVRPCYGDYRTPLDDDCLAPNAERAWSSPIWVRPPTTL